jgi:hypothetical protein
VICQRCGYCCIHLDVNIVNPRTILPGVNTDPGEREVWVLKPKGQRCPHLSFHGDLVVCVIHAMPCYKGSPCDQFEQLGREDDLCVLGAYFKAAGYEK